LSHPTKLDSFWPNFLNFQLKFKDFLNDTLVTGNQSPQKKTELISEAQKRKKMTKKRQKQNTVYVKFPVTKMVLTSLDLNFDQNQN